jgi:hypothetical protein
MRRISLALAIGSVIAVALLFSTQGSKSTGYSAVGAGIAYAQDDDPIPLPPRPRPGTDPACGRVCLESAGGAKYCGTGAGQVGCKSIVNNNCIYTLCAP